MRRLWLILLCALVAAPAALASAHATGDGVLELRSVDGTVLIGTNPRPAYGALWGQMNNGTLKVTDPDPTDGAIFVSGADKKPVVTETPAGRVTTYIGKNLTFRVTGGTYRLLFSGSGIDLTAVGVGIAYLNGDINADDAGDYAVDGGKWQAVPTFKTSKLAEALAVPFGNQATSSATP